MTTTNRVVGLGGEAPADGGWSGEPVHWFPPDHGYGKALFAVRDGVQCGRWPGMQVDWGSWAARMTRAQIERFIDEVFGPPGEYEAHHDKGLSHLAEKMRALRHAVAALPLDRQFAVVARSSDAVHRQ